MKSLNWTKKQKEEFNRLYGQDKNAFLEVAIEQAINSALLNKITESMIAGELLCSKRLYEKYVCKLDDMTVNSFEWAEEVQRLLSDIRTGYLKYQQKYGMTAKKQEAGDGGE